MDEPILIKKNSITNKAIQKQKRILIIAVFCVITIFISGSYALLTNYDQTDNVIVFKTGNLNMTVNNQNGLINLNGKLPQSDVDALANNEPVTLTLTNTGTISIGYFEVKLTKEDGKESTLEEKNIRYAVSTDGGATYSTIANLHESNSVVYYDNNLEVGTSKTVYLKLWIDENVGSDALDKTYYGSISVDLYQQDRNLNTIFREALIVRSETTITDTDGTIYLSGAVDDENSETVSDVDYNYIWYSGKLWRIVALYSDGRAKLVSVDNMTTIHYGNTSFYTNSNTTSYAYEWLNQEFLPTLYNYENIIVTDYKWNATVVDDATTKPTETTLIESPVGLLNTYEYYKSYENLGTYENSYLNNKYYWWLLNLNSSSAIWTVRYGELNAFDVVNTGFYQPYAIRPSIVLKSNIQVISGDGSLNNPYKISGDKEAVIVNTTLLNSRSSGEYVTFNNAVYRIVGTDTINSSIVTKLNMVDPLKDINGSEITKKFASTNIYGASTNNQSDTYWDYYLNNTWYNSISNNYKNMLVKNNYYLGMVTDYDSYKLAICQTASNNISTSDCTKTSTLYNGYVGLPRYGEMFSVQFTNKFTGTIYLTTPYSASDVWRLDYWNRAITTNHDGEYVDDITEGSYLVRPTITLGSTVKITAGSGTEQAPYEISL